MQRWNHQTRVIVACAIVLGALDICVRLATAPKAVSSSIVTAQEFRLTDHQGNVRAIMGVNDEGEPGLKMYDKNNTLRLQLDSFETTPSLILMDEHGNKRAYYGMSSPTGDGELSLLTPGGSTIASLRADGEQPSFSLYDPTGNIRQTISNDEMIVTPNNTWVTQTTH